MLNEHTLTRTVTNIRISGAQSELALHSVEARIAQTIALAVPFAEIARIDGATASIRAVFIGHAARSAHSWYGEQFTLGFELAFGQMSRIDEKKPS